jgi:hypothetical protein
MGIASAATGESTGGTSLRRALSEAPAAGAFIAIVAVLALVGGTLARDVLTAANTGHSHREHSHAAPAVGDPVQTSFGVLAVDSVELLKGLTAKDLAGMTHGIQSLVQSDHIQVQVSVELNNVLAGAVPYAPEQFRVRVGHARPAYAPGFGSVRAGTLQPHAGLNATLGFVLPRPERKDARLWLEFADRGARPLRIDLGTVGAAAGKAVPPAHYHHPGN